MNQKNVQRLAELLMEEGIVCDGDPMRMAECLQAAEQLAARGVLVPVGAQR